MPANELISSQQITTKMLVPHERKSAIRGKNSRAASVNTVATYDIILLATYGETITQGLPLAIGADGKMYIASNVAADNAPAVCIAAEDGIAGDLKKIWTFGTRAIPGSNFAVQSPVFLGEGVLTTSLPTRIVGNLIQVIGKAVSATEIMISVEQAAEIL